MSAVILEVCVDEPLGLAACRAGGADRVELCAALAVGGLTPSAGLIRAAVATDLPCHALIRPRAGDFVYAPAEVEVMLADIATARDAGLAGVVLGAATASGGLDEPVLRRLMAAAQGMAVTLHRVVDCLSDPLTAVDLAITLGFKRILSSGGAVSAPLGTETLAAMQRRAAGRIEIMAGGGITPENARALMDRTGIRALHASCAIPIEAPPVIGDLGFGSAARRRTDAATVAALKAVMTGG